MLQNAYMTILLTHQLLNAKWSLSSNSFAFLLLISKSREEKAY